MIVSGTVFRRRLSAILALLEKEGIDFLFLRNTDIPDPMLKYLGCQTDGISVLIGREEKIIFTSKMQYASVLAEKERGAGIIANADIFTAHGKLKAIVKGKKIGVNGRFLTFDNVPRAAKKVIDLSAQLLLIRSVKGPEEIKAISRACTITKKILEGVELLIFSGYSEKELANVIVSRTFELGYEPAFKPIVATIGNSCYPHAIPGNKQITKMCLIDYGVKVDGYCSDISRCFFDACSSSFVTKMKKLYEYAKSTFSECMSIIEERAPPHTLADFYINACSRAGVEAIHSVGHGVGLEVHEYPFIKNAKALRLKQKNDYANTSLAGTCVAIEPAFYFMQDRYGVRFEETVYISKDFKAKVL